MACQNIIQGIAAHESSSAQPQSLRPKRVRGQMPGREVVPSPQGSVLAQRAPLSGVRCPVMSGKWTRVWFAATAGCVLAGVTVNAIVAANGKPLEGHFHSGIGRALNSFSYFTTLSNVLIGIAALLLALGLDRSSTAFRVLRLSGM